VKYLRSFTFLDASRIAELETATAREPERRAAQRELAREVTRLVHGDAAVTEAEAAARALFDGEVTSMSVSQLLEVFPNVPSSTTQYVADGWPVIDLLTVSGMVSSRGEAARLIVVGACPSTRRR
jgi:tyrosyl-tRNA synthetase